MYGRMRSRAARMRPMSSDITCGLPAAVFKLVVSNYNRCHGPLRKAERAENWRATAEDFASARQDRQAHAERTASGETSGRGGAARDQKIRASRFEKEIARRTGRRINLIRKAGMQETQQVRQGLQNKQNFKIEFCEFCQKKFPGYLRR